VQLLFLGGKLSENLNYTLRNFIGAGGGVSEPGLNRARSKTYLPLRYGGGLKILWRRPSWVQVPPPPPLCCFSVDAATSSAGIPVKGGDVLVGTNIEI